jgi:hypothetical protein
MLHATVESAARQLFAAVASLKSCEWVQARAQAECSWALYHSAASARLAFLAAAALGDTAQALRWRHRAVLLSVKILFICADFPGLTF